MMICIVIPHYDHVPQFHAILPKLVAHQMPLIVVDDGSSEESFTALKRLLDEYANEATLIRQELNRGKGGAVMTGLRAAHKAGFTHALQLDADGQHDTSAVEGFRREAEKNPSYLICGEPKFADDISKLRFFARFITLWLCWLESMSTQIRDAMCGLRVYPLESVVEIIDNNRLGQRMAFDSEILVRAVWNNIPLKFIPVSVRYPEGGKSHFRYLRDNIEISWMHTRLITGMLLRLPALLRRRRVANKKRAPR